MGVTAHWDHVGGHGISTASVIQQANLMPPTLADSASEVHLAYLVIRENMINHIFQQNSGYWQNGLRGLDAITDADHGSALVEYFGLSDSQLAVAAERMMKDGRHELAQTAPDGARHGSLTVLNSMRPADRPISNSWKSTRNSTHSS